MAGIYRAYSGGIETARRNPSYKNLFRLARALGVSLSQLFETLGRGPARLPGQCTRIPHGRNRRGLAGTTLTVRAFIRPGGLLRKPRDPVSTQSRNVLF